MPTKPTYEELEKRVRQLEHAESERRRAEKALHETETYFKAVMDNLSVGVAVNSVNPAVNFTYMNANFPRFYRTTREALANPDGFWESVYEDPAFREEIKKRVLEDCSSGDPERMHWEDVPITRQGEKSSFVSARNIPIPDKHLMISTVWDVTEHRQTLKSLRESEEKYRRIFENSVVGLFQSTPEGRFVNVNRAFAKMLHYDSPEQLVSSITDIASQFYVDPQDRAWYQQMLRRNRKVDGFEFKARCRDGSELWLTNSSRAYFDAEGRMIHIEGINSDITMRKQAEQALRESEQRFRELFDNMSAGVAIYDSPDDGRSFIFKDLNKSGLQNCRKHKTEVVGREAREVFPGIEALGLIEVFQRVWKTGMSEHHPSIKRKDNHLELWVENYVCKLPSGELVAVYEDTTARRQAEEAKDKLERRIQQAQKMESIGTLAGGIAHDFNNILSSMLGFTELALGDIEKGSIIEKHLQEVFTAGNRAKDLVNQILAFARQSDEEVKPVRVAAVAAEVLKFLRSSIPTTIEIRPNLASDSLIMGNPTQVHQLLMNLCTNAAHAMEDEGGILEVALKDVVFNNNGSPPRFGLAAGNYIEMRVSDTGAGIPPDIIESIFEPYFTTKPRGKGTGLGLAVTHGIVEKYGGKITVDSLVGKGTVFTLYLPITDRRDMICQHEAGAMPRGRERVLLVDDEAPIVRMCGQILERLGYTVTTKTNSIEALELFHSDPNGFDLVITDMTMPNMTGDRLAAAVMQIRPEIPVILWTGFSRKISDEAVKQIGIKALVYKPMAKADLAKTIRQVLDAGSCAGSGLHASIH
jgi:PAS domain S-box-containing protein